MPAPSPGSKPDQTRVRINPALHQRIVRLATSRGASSIDEVIDEAITLLERNRLAGEPAVDRFARLTAALAEGMVQRSGEIQLLALELNRLERALMVSQLTRLAQPVPPEATKK